MTTAPEGDVALLFTDIEGSTRLLQELGDSYGDFLFKHHRVLRRAIAAHGGFEVDTAGDSFFVAFTAVDHAVRAAVEAQRALAAWRLPGGRQASVRIGIHLGRPRVRQARYIGIDVHHAARIMAAAWGGQILVSAAARAALDRTFVTRDLGVHRLKDLSEPERLFQVLADGLRLEFPALKTLDNRPTNLPIQGAPLVGREKELGELERLVEQGRIVTLTGPGGVGKTRLALHLGAELVDAFSNGVYFISLAAVQDAKLVLPAIAEVLGLHESGKPHGDVLRDHLREREVLLILDNFEQVVEASPDVAELVREAPKLRIVATSRQALRLADELVFDLDPLPTAAPDSDAVELFVTRASALERGFRLSLTNRASIEAIVRRLDGLPLAIELAAARVRLLTVGEIAEHLNRRSLPFLEYGSRDKDVRHQTLRATIGWSFGLLTPNERAFFRRLGLFVGGWRLDAAEAVASPNADVLNDLGSLVEKSLVKRRDDPDGRTRYWMLETIREFAEDALDEDRADAQRAFTLYFRRLAEERGPGAGDDSASVTLLRQDAPNLRAMLEDLLKHDAPAALRTVVALGEYWLASGSGTEGVGWLERATAVAEDGDPFVRGHAYAWISDFHRERGHLDRARTAAEASLLEYERAGNERGVAKALHEMGEIAVGEGDWDGARAFYEASVRRAQAAGEDVTPTILNLGDLALQVGDWNEAVARTEEGLALLGSGTRGRLAATAYVNLGSAHLRLGRRDEATGAFLASLLGAREFRFTPVAAMAMEGLALIALDRGMNDVALGLARTGEALLAESGVVRGLAEAATRSEIDSRIPALTGTGKAALSLDDAVELASALA